MSGRLILAASGLAVGLALAGVPLLGNGRAFSKEASSTTKLRIVLSATLFQEVPKGEAKQALQDLQALVERQTGQACDIAVEDDIDKIARQLAERKIEFGCFVGHEFAWARLKNPRMRPLVIAVNGEAPLQAHVLVRKDSTARNLAQLRGGSFALPKGSRPHCRLYLTRRCEALGETPPRYFARVTTPATLADGLDDVIDGLVQATVVDSVCLRAYERLKPGRYTKLKEIQKSEIFPAPVIAYQPGVLEAKVLAEFREDLIRSKLDADSQRLLMLWKLTAFEPVPDDYEKMLEPIGKLYPPRSK